MKKILIILIILLMSFNVYGETHTFIDVEDGDWYYDTVTTLSNKSIISGYGDGSFRPDNMITVEEFITLTVKVTGEEEVDVIKKNWSDGFIKRAQINQWVQEGEFLNYSRKITRGEMSRIVLRAANVQVPDNYLSYAPQITDFNEMDQYWQNIALRVFSVGIISGYPDGSFGLDGQATRAEACAILFKIYDPSLIKVPDVVDEFADRKISIQNQWELLKPINEGEYYLTMPSASAPYTLGELNDDFLNDGLNTLNFIRKLAYLPGDTYYSASANDLAQHGAVLNAASEFSHTPEKPIDMSEDFYKKGYNATSSGNLAAGIRTLSTAVKRLIDDEDVSNISQIGHRRWFLLPNLFEVGFGYIEQDNDWRYYSVVKVFDGLETKEFEYDSVKWPSETAFPLQYYELSVPWSITLNPSKYDASKIDDIKVTMTNHTTGKSIYFDKSNKDLEGQFFNVETSGYGIPYCIIFRPDYKNEAAVMENDVISILVENVYEIDGTKTTINYQTKFFNLK